MKLHVTYILSIHSFIYSLTDWLINWFAGRLNNWCADCLIEGLIHSLILLFVDIFNPDLCRVILIFVHLKSFKGFTSCSVHFPNLCYIYKAMNDRRPLTWLCLQCLPAVGKVFTDPVHPSIPQPTFRTRAGGVYRYTGLSSLHRRQGRRGLQTFHLP